MNRSTQTSTNKFPDPISRGQIQIIKIAQKELGMDDDTYRAMLLEQFKVSSCTQLTRMEATRLIERFEILGFETKKRTRRTGSSYSGWVRRRRPQRETGREDGKLVRLASFQELAKIDALAALIDWEYRDGLKRWMEKRLRIDRVRTSREAWLVKEGLKKMFEHRMEKLCGKDWWDKQFDDPKIMRFIEEHRPRR